MLDIKDKRVIIVGTGKSGIGSTVLLEKNGALPLVYDSSEKTDKAAVKEFISEKLGWETKSELYTGVFPKERTKDVELAILSPGVYERARDSYLGGNRACLSFCKRPGSCNYWNKWKNNNNIACGTDHAGLF